MLFDIDFDVSVDQVTPVNLSLEAIREVEQFIYHEARLLDERRWQEWLDLWTEEGMYWIPHSYDQDSPYEHISLCWENKLLRELRIRRLENHRNWSQQPITQSGRVLGNLMIDGTDPEGYLVVRSSFHAMEWRGKDPVYRVGSLIHKLQAQEGGGWKLRMKQVNLVDRDAVHGAIQVYI